MRGRACSGRGSESSGIHHTSGLCPHRCASGELRARAWGHVDPSSHIALRVQYTVVLRHRRAQNCRCGLRSSQGRDVLRNFLATCTSLPGRSSSKRRGGTRRDAARHPFEALESAPGSAARRRSGGAERPPGARSQRSVTTRGERSAEESSAYRQDARSALRCIERGSRRATLVGRWPHSAHSTSTSTSHGSSTRCISALCVTHRCAMGPLRRSRWTPRGLNGRNARITARKQESACCQNSRSANEPRRWYPKRHHATRTLGHTVCTDAESDTTPQTMRRASEHSSRGCAFPNERGSGRSDSLRKLRFYPRVPLVERGGRVVGRIRFRVVSGRENRKRHAHAGACERRCYMVGGNLYCQTADADGPSDLDRTGTRRAQT